MWSHTLSHATFSSFGSTNAHGRKVNLYVYKAEGIKMFRYIIAEKIERTKAKSSAQSKLNSQISTGCAGLHPFGLEKHWRQRFHDLSGLPASVFDCPYSENLMSGRTFPCVNLHSCHTSPQRAWFCLTNNLPWGTEGPDSTAAFSSPIWRSPTTSASPQRRSVSHLGSSPLDLLNLIRNFLVCRSTKLDTVF